MPEALQRDIVRLIAGAAEGDDALAIQFAVAEDVRGRLRHWGPPLLPEQPPPGRGSTGSWRYALAAQRSKAEANLEVLLSALLTYETLMEKHPEDRELVKLHRQVASFAASRWGFGTGPVPRDISARKQLCARLVKAVYDDRPAAAPEPDRRVPKEGGDDE